MVGELRRELVKKEAELNTLKEDAALARKFKQELAAAEKTIESYEVFLIYVFLYLSIEYSI